MDHPRPAGRAVAVLPFGRRMALVAAAYALVAGLAVALVLQRVAKVYEMPAVATYDLPRHAEVLAREAQDWHRNVLTGAPAAQIALSADRLRSRLDGLAFLMEERLQVGDIGAQLRRLRRTLEEPALTPGVMRDFVTEARTVAGDIQVMTQDVVAVHSRIVREYALWTGALTVAVAAGGMVLLLLFGALRRKNAALRALATHDTLTGLPNRRGAQDQGAALGSLARRNGLPFAVAAIDLDHFKAINDTHGHPAGDAALQWTAGILSGLTRRSDVAARMGGEEFCLILPGTDLGGAVVLCERVRAALEAQPLLHDGAVIGITASIGVASGQDDAAAFEALYRRADRALYEAKAAGRNQVRAAVPLMPE